MPQDFFNNQFATLSTGEDYGNRANSSTERLNPYFDRYGYQQVQSLHDSLTAEAIQFGGVEVIYLRREQMNAEPLFGEDPRGAFNEAYPVSMYIEDFESWQGERDFFSRFGYTANDEMSVSINSRLFQGQGDGAEPREGDLVYFPMGNALLEITFVEDEDDFYIHGHLPTRQITMQKFAYNGEAIVGEYDSTGDGTADQLIQELTNLTEVDPSDSEERTAYRDEGNDFIDNTHPDPFDNPDY